MEHLDFTQELNTASFKAYPLKDQPEVIMVLPKMLTLSEGLFKAPSFHIEMVRGISPFHEPLPYAMLEMQLAPQLNFEKDAKLIFEKWPKASIYSSPYNNGILGIQLLTNSDEFEDQEVALTPIHLDHLSLSKYRYVQKITVDHAQFISQSLKKGVLLIKAYGVFEFTGVTAQLPVIISFHTHELLKAIKLWMDTSESFSAQILQNTLSRHFDELPISINSDMEINQDTLIVVLCDLVINHLCELQTPDNLDTEEQFLWKNHLELESEFTWDLRHTHRVKRYQYVRLDLFQEIRKLKEKIGFDNLVSTTIVEPLPTGFKRVELQHPFDQIPENVVQIGVKIHAPSNLPWRPQAIHHTVLFHDGLQRESAVLKFSPSETLEYQVTPFLIYKNEEQSLSIEGKTFTSNKARTIINRTHYPLDFAHIACDSNMFTKGQVSLFHSQQDEPILLSPEKNNALIAWPDSIIDPQIKLQIKDSEKDQTAFIELQKAMDTTLRLTDFAAYGFHKIHIHMELDENEVVAVDFIPSHLMETSDQLTTIVFTSEQQVKEWVWFSDQVYEVGYQFRFRESGTTTIPMSWSEVQDHTKTHLTLNSKVNNHGIEDI